MITAALLKSDTPLDALAARGLVQRLAIVLIGSWVIALSARINVPMYPVPMSMQTFAVLLIAATSGRNLAGQTLLAYLAQGAAGLPVFASGAGVAYFAGPTGGYLIGFLAAALLVGALADRGWNRSWIALTASVLLGHAVIFTFGVAWLSTIMGDLVAAIGAGFTPFIAGMIVKTALVTACVTAARRKGDA